MKTIVVGIDGSDGARAALSWAVEEARMRHAALRVVHAWTLTPILVPAAAFGSIGGAFPAPQDDAVFEDENRELLDAAVAAVLDGQRDVPVNKVLVRGSPVPALLEAAEDADLLIVGSRGLGGFGGLLLGSVSDQVAHHARCPVVIVRGGES
jgi:nucleotide-binding universal stress UspA family protein